MDFIVLQASDNVTSLGVAVLNNFNVYPDKYWYWIGAAAILGFAVLFNVLYTLALMYLNGKKSTFLLCQTRIFFFYLLFLSEDFNALVSIN